MLMIDLIQVDQDFNLGLNRVESFSRFKMSKNANAKN